MSLGPGFRFIGISSCRGLFYRQSEVKLSYNTFCAQPEISSQVADQRTNVARFGQLPAERQVR